MEDHEKIQTFSFEELWNSNTKQSESDKNSLALKSNESANKKNKMTESSSPKQSIGVVEKPLKYAIRKKTNKVGEFTSSNEFYSKGQGSTTFQVVENLKDSKFGKTSTILNNKTSCKIVQKKNNFFLRKIADRKNFCLKGEKM